MPVGRSVLVVGLVAAIAVLTSCSTTSPAIPTDGANETTTPSTAQGHFVPAAEVELASGYGTDAGDGEFPRDVVHAAGTTTVTAAPERVVVLATGQLDGLVSLDLVPVGAAEGGGGGIPEYLTTYAPELATQLDEVAAVGTRAEPSLEAIAALEPDLILGAENAHADFYDQLSTIAPTVLVDGGTDSWRQDYLLVGETLGREADARRALDEVTEVASVYAGDLAAHPPVVSIIRFQEGRIRAMGAESTSGQALAELGLNGPAAAPDDDQSVDVSPEQLADLDADAIFYGSTANDADEVVAGLSLWSSLSAVRAGAAYPVADSDMWFTNAGPIASLLVVREVGDQLTR